MALATLSIDLEARLGKLQQDLDKAGRLAEKNADQIRAAYTRVGAVAAGLGATIAGAFAGFSVLAFVKGNAEAIDALNDVKDATGASIENISGLEQVAMRTGTTLSTVGDVLIKFNKGLSEGNPNGPLTQTLKSIGLSAEELRKLDPAEALRLTAVALSRYADDGNKARIIQELFGKSVKEAAPFLHDLAEAGELNGRITTQQAEEAEKFNKQLFELKTNADNLARALASQLIPKLNELFDLKKRKGFVGGLLDLLGFDDNFDAKKKLADVAKPVIDANAQVREQQRILAELNLALERDAKAGLPVNRAYDQARDSAEKALSEAQGRLEKAKIVFNTAVKLSRDAVERQAFAADKAGYDPLEKLKATQTGKTDAAALQEQKRYENLIKKVGERLELAKAELSIGGKLSEGDKLRIDVLAELNSAKFTELHQVRIRGLLDEAVATLELREAQAEQIKAMEGIAKISERLQSAQVQRIDALISENLSMREANEEIGLNIRQVEALRIARLEDKLALEEQALAMALNAEASGAEVQGIEQTIRLLRERIALRKGAVDKTDAISQDPLKGATDALTEYGEQVKRTGDDTREALRGSLVTAEDSLTSFFTTGRLNAGKFAQDVVQSILRIGVVKPFLNGIANQVGGLFGTGSAAVGGSSAGSILDLIGGFFSGAFASGGDNRGGVRLVGENGPELELTGPSRIFSADQTRKILSGANQGGASGPSFVFNIASGVTRNELAAMVPQLKAQIKAELVQSSRRPGYQGE